MMNVLVLRKIAPSLLLLFFLKAGSANQGSKVARKPLILKSLSTVFYRGNPLPTFPNGQEIEQARVRVANAREEERAQLTQATVFANHSDLWALALRDSDGDGVKDFFIDEENGRFYEGDLDLDGDGIWNAYDAEPYDKNQGGQDTNGDGFPDKGFRDENQNGIPDHADWALQGKSPRMVEIQNEIFQRYRILLVERSEDFSERLAETLHDAIFHVFRDTFEKNHGIPTLRFIASQDVDGVGMGFDLDGQPLSSETFGLCQPSNKTLTIYRKGSTLSPFLLLGLIGHEMTHHLQFAMDFDPVRQDYSNNVSVNPKFYKLTEAFGWTVDSESYDPSEIFTLFTPAFTDWGPSEFHYRGKPAEEWQKWIEAKGEGYLDQPDVKAAHIVGKYSLSDPWEWHADHFIAYLFNELEAVLKPRISAERFAEIQALSKEQNASVWNFYHGNAEEDVMRYFRAAYPLSSEERVYLAEKYLLPLEVAK